MDLVDHWVVGFSGKRQLDNPQGVRRALHDVLKDLRTIVDGQLVAMSSAAIGGDLLFVEEANRAGIPWICVLPFPEEAFFNERDFPDSQEREKARHQFHLAADCEVVRVPRYPDELSDSTWRRGAFAEAGFRCVEEADVLIAVLDEDESGKPGGTRDVVKYARAIRRPLVLIDPATQKVRKENWPLPMPDPVTVQLLRVHAGKLTPSAREELPTPAAIRVAEWRSGWARVARHHVPGIRWGTSAVVVLHALATIITASVFLLLHPAKLAASPIAALHSGNGLSIERLLEISAFLFVFTGFCFLLWLIWKRPQQKAANYRLAAEIGRSIIATWLIPEAASEILRGLPRSFAHFARTLHLQQRLDPDRRRAASGSPPDIEKIATDYIKGRIMPQIVYYTEKRNQAKHLAGVTAIASVIFSSIAVVSAGFLAFMHSAELHRAVWGFAKLTAATAAPVTVSLLVIHEVKRREARYEEMKDALDVYAESIRHVRSFSSLKRAVTDVERMLLGECHEWWVLAKANVAA